MADEPKKDEQKPLDVAGDVTPISKKEIKPVDATQWHDLSIMQLYEQMSILQDRLIIAQNMKSLPLVAFIENGIKNLQSIIESKAPKSGIF